MSTLRKTFIQREDGVPVDEKIAHLRHTIAQRRGRILNVIKWRRRDAMPHRAEVSYTLHDDSDELQPLSSRSPGQSQPPVLRQLNS